MGLNMNWTWSATIITTFGNVRVSVQAPTQSVARLMIEAQYGAGSILGGEVLQS